MVPEWRSRMRFIIDLVFASAMTVLILSFKIPETVPDQSTQTFMDILFQQSNSFSAFVISFLVITVYWVKNLESFNLIEKVDKSLIWFFMVYLIFIMLIPVANLLFVLFPSGHEPRVLFSIIMITSGLTAYGGVFYAHKKNLLKTEYDVNYMKTFTNQMLSEPIIAAIAMGLAFINPFFWDISFVLIPVIMVFSKKALLKFKQSS
ncbi:DUF1211 domain-containing protein [bacterium SCSIO 12741]|nr:DUF1211 domain-containing protein [bacterium SCSIO 12741]